MKVKLVYEQVREKIESDARRRMPGEALDSEMKYMRELDVSRLTVRKAVDDLVERGLVRRVPGKGLIALDEDAGRAHAFKFLISLPFVVEDGDLFKTVTGCIEAANRLGLEYKILAFTDVNERLEMIRAETLSDYAGAVVSRFESPADRQMLELLDEAQVPFIVIGDDDGGAPCMSSDDFAGGYLSGECLLQRGHRDIVYLTSDRPISVVRRRTEGFIKALRDYGAPVREEYIVSVKDPGIPLLVQHAGQRELPPQLEPFIRGDRPFTALTGYSTLPIQAACSRLYHSGLRVPEDISVVGYNHTPYIAEQNMPISSVVTPNYDMGAGAVEALYALCSGAIDRLSTTTLPISFLNNHSIRTLTPLPRKESHT